MSSVVVLDYGSGNVRSAVRALERVGADVELSADPQAAIEADGLVVPGVGAFAACMAGLREVQAHRILTERVAAGRPVLGICVGMQVLFTAGVEHGVETAGLGLLPGRVERLNAPVIPHMGWNTVRPPAGSVLFDGLEQDARFYFVHSYAVHPDTELTGPTKPAEPAGQDGPAGQDARPGPALTLAEHGEDFVAAVEAGPVSATQFHPEKSGDAGARLLANWLDTL
jgi:glutamine amidotransferase